MLCQLFNFQTVLIRKSLRGDSSLLGSDGLSLSVQLQTSWGNRSALNFRINKSKKRNRWGFRSSEMLRGVSFGATYTSHICRTKTSVNRHQHKPRNIPEEWRIQLHCAGSLTPRKYSCCLDCTDNSPSYKGKTSELLRSHGWLNISTIWRVVFTRPRIREKRPLLPSCQSISPSDARVSAAPTGRISVKFGNEYFYKTLSSNSILVIHFWSVINVLNSIIFELRVKIFTF
jgi:hypothetical protein